MSGEWLPRRTDAGGASLAHDAEDHLAYNVSRGTWEEVHELDTFIGWKLSTLCK